MPIQTTLKVGLDLETIVPSPLIVRAYDNTSKKVMGSFKAPCKIGLMDTIVEFHVMNITPSYNLLLGRAWLHPIKAIPFALHQKMKIPIYGLEGEDNEFQISIFEFVNMTEYRLKDKKYTTDLLPYCRYEVIAMMKKMRYMPSINIGKEGKEMAKLLDFKT